MEQRPLTLDVANFVNRQSSEDAPVAPKKFFTGQGFRLSDTSPKRIRQPSKCFARPREEKPVAPKVLSQVALDRMQAKQFQVRVQHQQSKQVEQSVACCPPANMDSPAVSQMRCEEGRCGCKCAQVIAPKYRSLD